MAYPDNPWRSALQPASFRGAEFHVETDAQVTGRRNAVHEFPKADVPFAEDMGRRARRWPMTAYVIGPDYLEARDAVLEACEAEGPGQLIHPSLGTVQANCETCSAVEVRDRGGYCLLEMAFVESGANPGGTPVDDTQSQVNSAATDAENASTKSVDNSLMSV